MKRVPIRVWYGCYDRQWSGVFIPDAFKHPAKFARGLVERIFEYGEHKGYWHKGEAIGDPFGGVAGAGIIAADRGYQWIGNELEKPFVDIGNRNLDPHRGRWKQLGRPQPILLQGDSRRFDEIIKDIDTVVTSPPFTGTRGGAQGIALNGYEGEKRKYVRMKDRTYLGEGGERTAENIEKLAPGQVDAAITSPPYSSISAGAGGLNHLPAKHQGQQSGRKRAGSQDTDQRYGDDQGQIAKLGEGGVEAVITSPPHENSLRGQKDGIDWDKAKRNGKGGSEHQKRGQSCHADYQLDAAVTSPPYDRNKAKGHVGADKFKDPAKFAEQMSKSGKGHSASAEARQAQFERDRDKTYGDSPGQIGELHGGNIDGAVTSPPYGEKGTGKGGKSKAADKLRSEKQLSEPTYGASNGQIGRAAGETYWHAMKKVYTATFKALRPGGYAAIVVKDYVRKWQRVPLCDDTMKLLEHIGFIPVERIHAMLTETTEHEDLFEGTKTVRKERKSFFRRLQESKGSPRIDYEEVLIVRKPCL